MRFIIHTAVRKLYPTKDMIKPISPVSFAPGRPARRLTANIFVCALLLFAATSKAAPPTDSSTTTNHPPAFSVEKHGHGTPVILIPGLGSSGAVWKQTVAALQDKHECHVLTLAGFAGQPPSDAPLIDAVAKELPAYIRAQKLAKPALIGHSLGGFLTLRIAAENPDLVGPIIVVDSLPCFGCMQPGATPESMKASSKMFRDAMEQQSREQFLASSKQTLAYMVAEKTNQDTALTWMAASDKKTVADAFAYLFSADIRSELPKIKRPALILQAGAEPGAVPENIYTEQYQGLAGAKLVRDSKARHFIMLDDPDFFLTQVKSFLDH